MFALAISLPSRPLHLVFWALGVLAIFLLATFVFASRPKREAGAFQAYAKFIYACFLKPHTGDGNGDQQDALVTNTA